MQTSSKSARVLSNNSYSWSKIPHFLSSHPQFHVIIPNFVLSIAILPLSVSILISLPLILPSLFSNSYFPPPFARLRPSSVKVGNSLCWHKTKNLDVLNKNTPSLRFLTC